jgi:Domain of unknown function (DUF4406)
MSTDRSKLAWYVCGPMTGIPRFNYPLFDLVTQRLRLTAEVISPCELDSQAMQDGARASPDGDFGQLTELSNGETWGDVLARDVRIIEKRVGQFALLPGWQRSRGARLEVFVGLLVGVTEFHQVIFASDGTFNWISLSLMEVRQQIRDNMP